MTDKKDDIEIKVSMAGVDTPVDAGKEATDAPNVASVKNSDTSLGAQAESSVEPKPTEAEKNEGAVPSRDTEDTVKEEGGESKKGTNIKEKKTKTKGKGKKPKGSKKEKEKKERQKISIKDIPALLFPEHLGDIFMIFVIFALAIGAGAFWFLAWLPTNEPATTGPQENIRRFSEEELQEIIEILDSREEASKAPVNPPTRDPFSD